MTIFPIIRNARTCPILDKWMNDALKKPEFKSDGKYTVMLNGRKIWIGNYPYAYGKLYGDELLPSRSTVKKLRKAHMKWLLEGSANE